MNRRHLIHWLGAGIIAAASASWAPAAEPAHAPALPEALEPLMIDGKEWTFRTAGPPRDQRKIHPHPRLWLSAATLPAIREKFLDPAYEQDLAKLRKMAADGDLCANALLYRLDIGDREALGRRAKEMILAGKFPSWPGLDGAPLMSAALAYDWTAELFTPEERKAALALIRKISGGDEDANWFDTRAHGRASLRVLVPLAFHGDGADDEWCAQMLQEAYEGETPTMRGPYGPQKGQGYLDVLNSMALDSGGSQAGNHGDSPTTGYTHTHMYGASLVLPAWQTATGEKVVDQCNFLRRPPYWLAYESDWWQFKSSGGKEWRYGPKWMGLVVLECATGLYRESDPDMAALAAWHLQTVRRESRLLIPRMIMGDLRVKPKSPEELELPTAAYLRGADVFISKTGWGPDDTHVRFQIRYLDTNRYEEHTNLFQVTKFGQLAASGRRGKGSRNPGNTSGIWFYQGGREDEGPQKQQGSTYWSGLQYPAPRAPGGLEAVTNPAYNAGGPVAVGVHEGFRFATGDATRSMSSPGAKRYVRTLAHVLPLADDREFVIVHDRTEAAPHVKRAWNLRTVVEPSSDGQAKKMADGHTVIEGARQFNVVNEMGNCHGAMSMTVVLPEKFNAQWRGGVGFETVSPEGTNYLEGHERGEQTVGFAADEVLRYHHGLGNLFIHAQGDAPRQNYLMVMQLGDSRTFDPAINKAPVLRLDAPGSDAVQVDEWVAVFSSEPGQREKASYTLAADGAKRHVVLDLAPGEYVVKKGTAVIAEAIEVKEKDFSLSFDAAGGKGDGFAVQRQ